MSDTKEEAQEVLPEGEAAQMLKPYGVGIDTHSKFIAVCVLKRKGDKIYRSEKDFGTQWQRLKEAAAWVRAKLPEVPEQELDYCIESTGTYHMPVLQAFEGRPSVVNPMLAGATHRKTDVLDARMLAKQSMTNTWPRSFIPAQKGQIVRVLWNQKREAQRYATRNFNRINNILLRFGHTFAATTPCRSQEGLAIIDALLTGEVTNHPGTKPERLPKAINPVITKLLKDGEKAQRDTKEAQAAAVEYVHANEWASSERTVSGKELLELLQTVPGVGQGTAMVWLAEVVDPRRFQNSKQVAAYCGCDPSLKVSAGKVTQHVRRKGNLKLHDALLQCATSVIVRGTTPLGVWGKAIAEKSSKGGFRKACGAVARRIACGLWHVHRKAEPFSYAQYTFQQETVEEKPAIAGLQKDGETYVLDRTAKFHSKSEEGTHHDKITAKPTASKTTTKPGGHPVRKTRGAARERDKARRDGRDKAKENNSRKKT